MCWAPPSVVNAGTNISIAWMRSHPLWRLGHTWGIRVISTRFLDIGFSECCLFSFLLYCFLPLPSPQQCLIWGNISQTGIYKHDYVSLKIVRTFNTWLMATLLNFSSLFSSTRPLRVFPSPCPLPLLSWAAMALSQDGDCTVREAHTPRLCGRRREVLKQRWGEDVSPIPVNNGCIS